MSRLLTKPTKWLCAQRKLRSAWASAQSDQSLRCPNEESLGPQLPIERTAKTLFRLGGCPGWSVFAGRTVTLLVLSCRGSCTDRKTKCNAISCTLAHIKTTESDTRLLYGFVFTCGSVFSFHFRSGILVLLSLTLWSSHQPWSLRWMSACVYMLYGFTFFYSSRALGARRRQSSLTVVLTGDLFTFF